MEGYGVQRCLSNWWLRRAHPKPLPFPPEEGDKSVAEDLDITVR